MDQSVSKNSRRDRIIKAARAEFLSGGFRAVDLGRFAADLGISKKTLYLEFSSKRDLVAAVLADKVSDVEYSISSVLKNNERASHSVKIRGFLECIQLQLSEVKPPFLRDLNRDHPELFEIITSARKKIIPNYFGQIVSSGQRSGEIRRDIPQKMIVQIFMALADSILVPDKMLELEITPKRGFDLLFSAIMEGVEKRK